MLVLVASAFDDARHLSSGGEGRTQIATSFFAWTPDMEAYRCHRYAYLFYNVMPDDRPSFKFLPCVYHRQTIYLGLDTTCHLGHVLISPWPYSVVRNPP